MSDAGVSRSRSSTPTKPITEFVGSAGCPCSPLPTSGPPRCDHMLPTLLVTTAGPLCATPDARDCRRWGSAWAVRFVCDDDVAMDDPVPGQRRVGGLGWRPTGVSRAAATGSRSSATALAQRLRGHGHRRIGQQLGVPAGTVRGSLRRVARRSRRTATRRGDQAPVRAGPGAGAARADRQRSRRRPGRPRRSRADRGAPPCRRCPPGTGWALLGQLGPIHALARAG